MGEATTLESALCAVIADRRLDDELRQARAVALRAAVDVARDRGQLTGDHPGADAVLATARDFTDFIWSGK